MNDVVSGTWHLVTGDRQAIYSLARDSYFVELDDPTGNTNGNLIHTESVALVDGQRRIRGVYNGTIRADIARLIEDIETLQLERLSTAQRG